MPVNSADVLIDGFDRVREAVHEAVDGMRPDDLTFRVDESANSIAWLVWHLTRVQDDHIAHVADLTQVWTARDWVGRFGLALEPTDTGYGHGVPDVDAVRVASAELLIGYHDEVYQQTVDYVRDLTDADLPRIVDTRWDPPVTLGVRLMSVIADDLQHAGQAAFVRGVLLRR
jgi:uncharacterized damage-inducible protein DinB